jgi:hypothetical protein
MRDKQTVGFIVIMPALLLVLLASIFGHQPAARAAGSRSASSTRRA